MSQPKPSLQYQVAELEMAIGELCLPWVRAVQSMVSPCVVWLTSLVRDLDKQHRGES